MLRFLSGLVAGVAAAQAAAATAADVPDCLTPEPADRTACLQVARHHIEAGDTLFRAGRYPEAFAEWEPAIRISTNLHPARSPERAEAVDRAGLIHYHSGRFAEAERQHRESVGIRQSLHQSKDVRLAEFSLNLAEALRAQGRLAEAWPLLTNSVALYQAAGDPDMVTALGNLARLCIDRAQPARALTLAERVLRWIDRSPAITPELAAEAWLTDADILNECRHHRRAIDATSRAIAYCDKSRTTASDPMLGTRIQALQERAEAWDGLRHPADACRDILEAWALTESGPGADFRSDSLRSTAAVLLTKCGQGDRAAHLLRESPGWTNAHARPGEERLAWNAALVFDAVGDRPAAREAAEFFLAATERLVSEVYAISPEPVRFRFHRDNAAANLAGTLADPDLVLRVCARLHGVIQESIHEDHQFARIARPELHQRLRSARTRLLNWRINGVDPAPAGAPSPIDELQRVETEIGLELRQRAPARAALGIDLSKRFLDRIPPADAAVAFVRYRHYQLAQASGEDRFGALLIQPGNRQLPLQWIPLRGTADEIDREVAGLLAFMGSRATGDGGLLKSLSERVWQPIASRLHANPKRLWICPDGFLSFVPFAALPEGSGFAGDRFEMVQVNSLRDIHPTPPPPSHGTMLGIAVHDFGRVPQRFRSNPFGITAPFSQLRGTGAEIERLAVLARSSGWKPVLLKDSAANEMAVAASPAPTLAHLATHAFAGTPRKAPGDAGDTDLFATMLQAGIALHGANAALGDGSAVAPAADGILTAEEVTALDLHETWATVLTTCNAGLGKAIAGEGVLGLRRAFARAGTRHLAMPLWPVWDGTSDVISQFEEGVFQGADPISAFHQAQMAALHRAIQSRPLGSAVRSAGAYVLVSH